MEKYLIIVLVACFLFLLSFNKRNKIFSIKKNKHKKKQKQSQRVYEKLKQIEGEGQKLNYLRKIDPFTFEELILDSLKRKGYQVIRNKKYTGDGGIDGKVIINEELFFIQAKRYRSHINLQHVIDFENVLLRKRTKGLFIHTGKTGKGTKKVIYKSNFITLISGEKLLKLIM